MTPLTKDNLGKMFSNISLIAFLGLWPALSFSSALTEVCLWVAVSALILSFYFNKLHLIFPDRTSLILIGLFFICVIISLIISDYPKQSFRGFFKLIRHFLIFFLALNLFKEINAFEKWRRVMLISFLVLTVNGMAQYCTGVDILRGFYIQESSSGWRITGSFETYGKFASYLCTVLPAVLFFTIQSFRIPKLKAELILWIPLSLVGGFLLFATRSRGGLLAFFLGIVLLLLMKRAWKLLGVLVLCGTIFLSVLPVSMVLHLDVENKEQSIVERIELWHRALDVILAQPLTGTGINTYAVAHQKYDTRKSWRVQNYYAHNGYLQMGAEIGVPGLLFFLAFLGRWIWFYRPRDSDEGGSYSVRWGLLGGIFAFLILCTCDTVLHSPQPVMVFWYVMGLFGALSPKLKNL